MRFKAVSAIVIIAASCSSGSADGPETTDGAAEVTTTAQAPAGVVQGIVDFVEGDAELLQTADQTHMGAFAGEGFEIAARQAECEAVLPMVEALRTKLPSPIDEADVDKALGTYRQAWQTKAAAYISACEAYSTSGDEMQAEVTVAMAEFGFPEGTKLLELEIDVGRNIDAVIDACFSLQSALEAVDPAPLQCVPGFPNGDGGSGEGTVFGDADPLAGPTGIEEVVLLEPGEHRFEWFPRPFTITNAMAFEVASTEIGIVMLDPETFGQIELLAVTEVADPGSSADEPGGLGETIPAPDDLTDWIAQLPLLATSEPATVGGLEATYWILEFDRAAEESIVPLWTAAEPAYGATMIAVDEAIIHLWHIQHPDGALFVYEFDWGLDLPLIGPDFIEKLSF